MTLLDRLLAGLLNALSTPPVPRAAAGLQLGHTIRSPQRPIVIPDERRFEHLAILGKTGVGKTTLLLHLALQHMQRGEGFVFFDYHGDAAEQLAVLAAAYPLAAERLVLLDLSDPRRSPGINPLESRGEQDSAYARAAELTSILKARWQMASFGARTEEVLRNTLFTLAESGLTLLETPLLLTDRPFRQQLVARLSNEDIKHFWLERFEPLSEAMKSVVREPILNKVTAFITEPLCRHLLGQRVSTFRFGAAMQAGSWVIVSPALNLKIRCK